MDDSYFGELFTGLHFYNSKWEVVRWQGIGVRDEKDIEDESKFIVCDVFT